MNASRTASGSRPASTTSPSRTTLPVDLAILRPSKSRCSPWTQCLHHLVPGGGVGLGALVLVVREAQVDPAGVHVDVLAEEAAATSPSTRCASRGSPGPTGCPRPSRGRAGASTAPSRRGTACAGSTPSTRWPGFSWSSRLPEISPYVGKDARVEEDRAVGDRVGVSLLDQLGDQLEHRVDRLGGPRGVLGRAHVERGQVRVERVLVEPRDVQRGLALGPRLRPAPCPRRRVDLGVVRQVPDVGDVLADDRPGPAAAR